MVGSSLLSTDCVRRHIVRDNLEIISQMWILYWSVVINSSHLDIYFHNQGRNTNKLVTAKCEIYKNNISIYINAIYQFSNSYFLHTFCLSDCPLFYFAFVLEPRLNSRWTSMMYIYVVYVNVMFHYLTFFFEKDKRKKENLNLQKFRE